MRARGLNKFRFNCFGKDTFCIICLIKVFCLHFVSNEEPLHLFKHTFLRIWCGHILFQKADVGESVKDRIKLEELEAERNVTKAVAVEAVEGDSY